jgi:hypothetical protein
MTRFSLRSSGVGDIGCPRFLARSDLDRVLGHSDTHCIGDTMAEISPEAPTEATAEATTETSPEVTNETTTEAPGEGATETSPEAMTEVDDQTSVDVVTDGVTALVVASFDTIEKARDAYDELREVDDGETLRVDGAVILTHDADGNLEVANVTDHSTRT